MEQRGGSAGPLRPLPERLGGEGGDQWISTFQFYSTTAKKRPSRLGSNTLAGALLTEKQEECSTGRRYLTMDEFYAWREEQTNKSAEARQ